MDLKGSGVSHEKKAMYKYSPDVPSRDNKIEGVSKYMKGALLNGENSHSCHYIHEDID